MEFITLENKDNSRLIKDVIAHPYKVNEDSSGVLVETLRKDWMIFMGRVGNSSCSITLKLHQA